MSLKNIVAKLLQTIKNYFKTIFHFRSTYILLFPNAPYMLTDLIHLRVPQFRNAPLWYDLIMLLTFGFAGLYYGFISLQMIEEKISTVFNCRFSKWISIGFIYISCFGIYLGRFLRFNSWDLFGNFSGLMKSVLCINLS